MYKNGMSNGMKKRWFKPSKVDIAVNPKTPESKMVDSDSLFLAELRESDFFANGIYEKFAKDKRVKTLCKRKTQEIKSLNYYIIQPGTMFSDKILVLKADLTAEDLANGCLLYTSPSPRDKRQSRMPSSA